MLAFIVLIILSEIRWDLFFVTETSFSCTLTHASPDVILAVYLHLKPLFNPFTAPAFLCLPFSP